MASKDQPRLTPIRPSPTANTKPNRLPAPTLFVGPPSRNASQLSVSRQGVDHQKPIRDPLTRQKSALGKPFDPSETNNNPSKDFSPVKKQSDKDVDARWRELQSTLNEVELTAQSSTHVFGANHAKALDELRRAQVELARAWGRGNEENARQAAADRAAQQDADGGAGRFQGAEDIAKERAAAAGEGKQGRKSDGEASGGGAVAGDGEGGEGGGGARGSEDETALDIKLASERRAANEAYFKKVDEGVKEVVAKLEVVAEAMKEVEAESRSLWSQSSRTSEGVERNEEAKVGTAQEQVAAGG